EDVVRTFLWPAPRHVARDHNPAVGEGFLFADLVVRPAGGVELGDDVGPTSVGFGERDHKQGRWSKCRLFNGLRLSTVYSLYSSVRFGANEKFCGPNGALGGPAARQSDKETG